MILLRSAVQIPPQAVRPKEWSLLKDLLNGEGYVGFVRGEQVLEVNKKEAREFLKNKERQVKSI